jgi:eukaryotic-like serine/threonine-protein kinase
VETITGYHLKTTLGTGGMASVYLATQESLDRQVAIKVLDASLIDDALIEAQFAQESKLIASLNHPNIVQVIDQGISDQGHPYFVMPYVKSISLSAILKRSDINITRKLDIAIQICKALAYAHRNGIVHRDIKPGNILVDYDGHVRLVDFGIAGYFAKNKKSNLIKNDNVVMGTDAYMAPEQIESAAKASHLSDIYSLGIVMHQLFFGRLPMEATHDKKNEFSEQLNPLINSCIEPTPEKRPANAGVVRQQLLLIAQGKHLRNNRWSNDSPQNDIPANYQVLDVLKENPFGATYLAKDPKQQRFLVIKKQKIDHLGNAQIANTKLTQVQHPHIARIFGTGKNQRVFITVSEYLSAGNLQERLTQAFTLGQWILMAQQIYSALSCAHAHGVIHGNLRPSNILFAENNFIKVTDFGFPAHSYSESDNWYRVKNSTESKSADIYAAGVILFQLLSGAYPQDSFFNWKNHWALRHVPRKLRGIVLLLTQQNTKKCYQNSEAAMQALKDFYDKQSTRMAEKIYITKRSNT